jgi:type VI secretion system protein ImpM
MTEPAIGYYGKFPSNGDFVSRNLPSTFIQKWDRWLQDAMEDARLTLGDEWIDAYLTGPIWRFALSSGICGDVSWMGLMIPNVDKVGRHFPLTIAAQVPDSESLLYAFANNDEWFEIVESLSLYTRSGFQSRPV